MSRQRATERDLRGTMRGFATGVAIATTFADTDGGRRHDAVTVNSLTSVSLNPPLVSLCFGRESRFLADLLESKVWAASILDGGASYLARRFAQERDSRTTSLSALGATAGEHTGALVLDAPAWLECVLQAAHDIGDHTMVVGEVVAAGTRPDGTRLVFLHGAFHVLDNPNSRQGDLT
ncbi:flavin reductase family protein [Rhodococcus koreensis]|jgi:flavin reductase (DIM6/NTAB) family NADH-FMN oxidoreductase RutF|uniref:flavin reductase family protein n=1 Tax=Rhodococcus koreensis TaxID=99653 RepID=UPI0036D83903